MHDTIVLRDIQVDFNCELGKGESSRVYRGRWMGVTVAVKRKKRLSLDALDREMDILRQLNHPHIVQFYGILYEKQSLVMECFPGTLHDHLQKHRPKCCCWWRWRARPRMMRMVQDVLCGLVYLHSLRIIHRDLKPSNILMTEHGRLKLGDFGLSEDRQGTRCSDRRGTLYYMAPEVFFEKPDYDERIDMWSFAVLLHDIFRTPPVFRVTERRHRFEYEITFPFKRHRVVLPNAIDALLKGCLKINPLSRMTSAQALVCLTNLTSPSRARAWFPICGR